MIKLAPSLLAADFSKLGSEIQSVEEAGVEYLHLDIMDGHFVPNLTIGPAAVHNLRQVSNLIFDVHLMVEFPDQLIEPFARAGAQILTVHVEATSHLHRTLQMIRQQGVKPAVALNPATPLVMVEPVLDQVEMVLIMTVNPGFGGQEFIPQVCAKIRQLRQLIRQNNLAVEIQVDGGITAATAPHVIAAGCDILVAGTAIFANPDRQAAVAALRACSRGEA